MPKSRPPKKPTPPPSPPPTLHDEVERLKMELDRETKLRMFFERALKELEAGTMKPSDYICPVCGITKQPSSLLR